MFNLGNTEIIILILNFDDNLKPSTKEKIFFEIKEGLELDKFAIKLEELRQNLEYFRRKGKRYIIQLNDYNENLNFLLESSNLNFISIDEINTLNSDKMNKILSKRKTSQINIIYNFAITSKIDEIIFLNYWNQNFYSDKFYFNSLLIYPKTNYLHCLQKRKLKESGQIVVGFPNLKNSILFYSNSIKHKIFFESLLTTCFTKRYENVELEVPEKYVISYIFMSLETDRSNKINLSLEQGWLLEKKLQIKVKSLSNFLLVIKVEIIPLSDNIFIYGL